MPPIRCSSKTNRLRRRRNPRRRGVRSLKRDFTGAPRILAGRRSGLVAALSDQGGPAPRRPIGIGSSLYRPQSGFKGPAAELCQREARDPPRAALRRAGDYTPGWSPMSSAIRWDESGIITSGALRAERGTRLNVQILIAGESNAENQDYNIGIRYSDSFPLAGLCTSANWEGTLSGYGSSRSVFDSGREG